MQAGGKSGLEEAALDLAGDEAVARADQMQDIDDAAIGIEHRARGEDHDGDGRETDQGQHRIGERFEHARHAGQFRLPAAMRVEARALHLRVSAIATRRRNRAARRGSIVTAISRGTGN